MTPDAGVLVVGLAAVVAFVAAFHVSGLVVRVRAAVAEMREAVTILADKNLDDEAKERLIRRGTLRLFGQSALLALTTILVLAALGAVVWIGHLIGLAPFAATADLLLSWRVIVGGTVAVAAIFWLARRR